MLRILSQDNLDHRGGFLKPLNKTYILQNKYLLSEQIIPLWTIPTPDPHLGPGIVRGQVTITRCSIPSGPEVSSQDICWHSDTLHFLLLPHAALCVCLCVWEYSDETRATGMDVVSCCWVKWKECCKLINKSAFIQFLMLGRPGNNWINGNFYCSVWKRTIAGNYQAQLQGQNRVIHVIKIQRQEQPQIQSLYEKFCLSSIFI